VSYPFSKYDIFFPHEFQEKGMENAGMVSFDDGFLKLFQQESPLEDKIYLASGLCHELSHHWFGNLVTMKWWDDLWLN
jgi:aminopeptidase N